MIFNKKIRITYLKKSLIFLGRAALYSAYVLGGISVFGSGFVVLTENHGAAFHMAGSLVDRAAEVLFMPVEYISQFLFSSEKIIFSIEIKRLYLVNLFFTLLSIRYVNFFYTKEEIKMPFSKKYINILLYVWLLFPPAVLLYLSLKPLKREIDSYHFDNALLQVVTPATYMVILIYIYKSEILVKDWYIFLVVCVLYYVVLSYVAIKTNKKEGWMLMMSPFVFMAFFFISNLGFVAY